MYTRDFGPQEAERNVPDSYCGNLFSEAATNIHKEALSEEKSESCGALSGFRGFFEKPFDFKKLPLFKKGFGTEELLLIGIAAFLLFSKDGDKECAVILLLTLFLG